MNCHHPRSLPPPDQTVLLLHWYDSAPDREPLCETGYYHPGHGYVWHNPIHNNDGVRPMAWMPLPMLPERAPL